jgi:hypothetical protein
MSRSATVRTRVNMKFRFLSRWRKSKKAKTPASAPSTPVFTHPRKSQISEQDHIRQAIENVRSSRAPPGEVYGLTILEDNEYLVGWMNVTNSRLSSASGVRRHAIPEDFVDWTSGDVEALEGGKFVDGEEPGFGSATSTSTTETNTSESKRFGKSGIEIPGCGRIGIRGPRIQVRFEAMNWNAPSTSRPEGVDAIGPAGETAA